MEIKGKYNTAKVFTNNIECKAIEQIEELCNQEFTKDSKIRIMPDVHSGCGCTIGTTMTIKDRVSPSLVGVDIGCRMYVNQLEQKEIDLKKLDEVINLKIPSGFSVRSTPHKFYEEIESDILKLKCIHDERFKNLNRIILSVGTLGGGNHFIEVNKDDDGNLYLVIHSGSRNLGKQVAMYYKEKAIEQTNNNSDDINDIINTLKNQGREKEINDVIKNISSTKTPKDLCYLKGNLFDDYIHDIKIVQNYANCNVFAITDEIISAMDLKIVSSFTTVHNYIDCEDMILRKGAVSAKLGEKLIIPINMRDGSLICTGYGNRDYNYSAPHGAGRLFSRKQAFEKFSLDEFKKEMSGVYSSSVNENTLDESPMAYKPIENIIENIKDTAKINKIIKPIYNFKAH